MWTPGAAADEPMINANGYLHSSLHPGERRDDPVR
jgi:hypothetical protein